jgi:hypothetical protein
VVDFIVSIDFVEVVDFNGFNRLFFGVVDFIVEIVRWCGRFHLLD